MRSTELDALRVAAATRRRVHDEAVAASLADWAQRQLDALKAPSGDPRLDWSRNHPELAASERALRKGRAEFVQRWKHKNEGTPETHEQASRCNQGALAALYKNGSIDAEQLASADEIAQVAERIGADVAVRTASLETRLDPGGYRYEALHDERIRQVRREMAYTRWRAQLPMASPVLEMLVGDRAGFTIVAKRYRLGNRRAKRLLIDALDLWPQILGDVCKTVDERDLNWAHARIAA